MDAPPPQYANYPRPGPGIGPGGPPKYWRPPGVYVECISDAWKLVNEDLGVWIACGLIYILLLVAQQIVSRMIQFGGALMPGPNWQPDLGALFTGFGVSLLFSALLVVIQPGMMMMAVKKARGESIQVSDMFAGYRRFWSLTGALFLMGLAIMLGFLCCIVPGIFLMGALAMTPLIVLDQGLDPVASISLSYKTLSGNAWMMFVVVFLAAVVAGVGVLACFVGYLFTLPLYHAAIGLQYHYLFPQDQGTGGYSQYGYGG